jgi:hypothetical protein
VPHRCGLPPHPVRSSRSSGRLSVPRDASAIIEAVKFTRYFQTIRCRPDRASIKLEWIEHVVRNPVKEAAQGDGRIRRWAPIPEMGGRYLRVILLSDGETVHNAFFDRSFAP